MGLKDTKMGKNFSLPCSEHLLATLRPRCRPVLSLFIVALLIHHLEQRSQLRVDVPSGGRRSGGRRRDRSEVVREKGAADAFGVEEIALGGRRRGG